MPTVSQEYLQGIREGRKTFHIVKNEPNLREIIAHEIKFCDDVKFWAGSGLHAEFIKGQRAFWQNQQIILELSK